jgi:hypothetical protein
VSHNHILKDPDKIMPSATLTPNGSDSNNGKEDPQGTGPDFFLLVERLDTDHRND